MAADDGSGGPSTGVSRSCTTSTTHGVSRKPSHDDVTFLWVRFCANISQKLLTDFVEFLKKGPRT